MAYIGNTPADKFLTLAKQSFSTSATTSYTLDSSISSTQDIALFINNVRQSPVDAYTVSGTALTLTSATAGTDEMYCVYLGKTVGTVSPASDSVTTAMLQANAVTTVKVTDGNITGAKLNTDVISAQTALGATPADTDELLVSDAGVLKRVDYSHIKSNPTHIARIENDSDVTSLSALNCFSSTYDIYKVVFYMANTQSAGDMRMRFQKNTSDDFTGTDLNGNMFGELGTTSPTHFDDGGVASSTYLKLSGYDVYNGASSGLAGEILIAYPYLRSNNRIHISYQGVADGSSGVITYVGSWVYSGSEVATGLQFYSSDSSLRFRKAEINVYGYNK
jgi:hypothetical protein